MFPKDIKNPKLYTFGIVFILCFLIFAAIINYFTWSKGVNLNIIYFVIWTLLYLPIFIFHKYSNWSIKDFGFDLNYKIITLTLLAFLLVIFNVSNLSIYNWKDSLIEMYARTGEELFFRGFIFMFVLKLFKNKKFPWIWAILISSICFTVVHTQTFLPNNNSTMIDIFLIAIGLSILRHWTKSILPGIIIHISSNSSSMFGIIIGIIFYYIFILVAYFKGEKYFERKT